MVVQTVNDCQFMDVVLLNGALECGGEIQDEVVQGGQWWSERSVVHCCRSGPHPGYKHC